MRVMSYRLSLGVAKRRFLLWLTVAIVLVGLVVFAAFHYQRESLARDLANDLLAGTGFRVESLSISGLQLSTISLSKLVLLGPDGSRYEARDVSTGLLLGEGDIRQAIIGEIVVVPGPPSNEPPAVATLLDTLLALPETVGPITVQLGTLRWSDWPVAKNLTWGATAKEQALQGTIDGLDVSVIEEIRGDGVYLVHAEVGTEEGGRAFTTEVEFARRDDHYGVQAMIQADLATLKSTFATLGALPVGATAVQELAGRIEGFMTGTLTDRPDDMLTVSGTVTADSSFTASTAVEEGHIQLSASEPLSVDIAFGYPAGAWTARAETAALTLAIPRTGTVDAQLTTIECGSGRPCDLQAALSSPVLSIGGYRVEDAVLSTELSITSAPTWLATLNVKDLSARSVAAEAWSASGIAHENSEPFMLSFDGAPVVTGNAMDVRIKELKAGDATNASLLLGLRELELEPVKPALRSAFSIPSGRSTLRYGDWRLVLPDLMGRFQYAGDRGTVDLVAKDDARALDAQLDVRLAADAVKVEVESATIDFAAAPLSRSLQPWPLPWDVESGLARLSGELVFRDSEQQAGDLGVLELTLEDAALRYEDIAATGIDATGVPVRLRADKAPSVGPAALTADLIDVGVPVTNVQATATWDLESDKARIEALRGDLMGGVARVDPFDVDTDAMAGNLQVHLESVQLKFITEMAKLESLKVSGAVSGMVPVKFAGSVISADAGRLQNDEPGAIRYVQPVTDGDPSSGLNVATRALSNLQYKSLTSEVTYKENGDLILKTRLEGINPDIDPLQPVILNLNVENNVPQLLRSLQAARDIEKIIESRSGQ